MTVSTLAIYLGAAMFLFTSVLLGSDGSPIASTADLSQNPAHLDLKYDVVDLGQ